MADSSKKVSALEMKMADGSKKSSGLGIKPGDLIEISRKHKLFEHWALCVSENEVIHIKKLSFTKYIIIQEKLETAVGSDKWRVNNRLDENNSPKDVQLILEEAQTMKGTEVSYSLIFNNCEHMVTDLRYGKRNSRQVRIGLIHMLLTGVPIILHKKKKQWQKGRQRSSTGPTKEAGETVSKEEDEQQYAEALVLGIWLIILNVALRLHTHYGKKKWQKGFQRNTCGPTNKRGETVSEEEAIPLCADTMPEGFQRNTCGPTNKRGATVSEEEAIPLCADTMPEGCQKRSTGPTNKRGETVSKVAAKPLCADTTALRQVVPPLILMMLPTIIYLRAQFRIMQREKSLQKSSTGPTKEGEETVSEVAAKPPNADTTAELTDVYCQVAEEREEMHPERRMNS